MAQALRSPRAATNALLLGVRDNDLAGVTMMLSGLTLGYYQYRFHIGVDFGG